MSNFEAINDLGIIDQYVDNGWELKYKKDPMEGGHLRINDQGKQVSTLYKGRHYTYIAGLEKKFTMLERIGRAIAGIFATLLTLGIACSFEGVRNLFASKKILHIGMDPVEESEVLEKLQGITSVQVHGKCKDETTPGLGCSHKCTIIREGKEPIEKSVTEKELKDLKTWGINVIFSPKIEKTHFKVDSKKNDILCNALEAQDAEIAEELTLEDKRRAEEARRAEKDLENIDELGDPNFTLGGKYEENNEIEKALISYDKAFNESEKPQIIKASALKLARMYEDLNDKERAIQFYKAAFELKSKAAEINLERLDPEFLKEQNPESLFDKAKFQYEKKNYKEAFDLYMKVFLNDTTIPSLKEQAVCNAATIIERYYNDKETAIYLYKKALEVNKESFALEEIRKLCSPEEFKQIENDLNALRRPENLWNPEEQTFNDLKFFMEGNDEDPMFQFSLGYKYEERKQLDKAIQCFENAFRISKDHQIREISAAKLAKIYEEKGEKENAVLYYSAAYRNGSFIAKQALERLDPNALKNIDNNFQRKELEERMERDLENDSQLLFNQAKKAQQKGDYRSALEFLIKAFNNKGANKELKVLIAYTAATILETVNNVKEAINCYQEMLKLENDNVIAIEALKRLEKASKDKKPQPKEFEKPIESDLKEDSQSLINHAFALQNEGKDDQAFPLFVSAYKNAQDLPTKLLTAYHAATICEKKGDLDQAIFFYEEMLKLDNNEASAQKALKRLKPGA